MVRKNPDTLVKKVNVKCLNIFKIPDCQFTLKNNKAHTLRVCFWVDWRGR